MNTRGDLMVHAVFLAVLCGILAYGVTDTLLRKPHNWIAHLFIGVGMFLFSLVRFAWHALPPRFDFLTVLMFDAAMLAWFEGFVLAQPESDQGESGGLRSLTRLGWPNLALVLCVVLAIAAVGYAKRDLPQPRFLSMGRDEWIMLAAAVPMLVALLYQIIRVTIENELRR